MAETRALPLIEVQHHHAHIASCLVDNRWPTGKSVIGVAMDGLGLGDNDEIWGGEFLLADYAGYRRLASLQPVAMAGGNLASRQPWRNTLAQLKAVGLWDDALSILQDLPWWPLFETQPLHELGQAIDTGFAFPRTSSCGRLFDAVAGMLGICADGTSYDGQAASELEAAQYGMNLAAVEAYPFACHNDHLLRIDPGPMWQALLEDIQKRESPRLISARFHAGLAAIIADTAVTLARRHRIDTVALSGGVFQNLSLLQHLLELFKRTELNVLQHDSIPCNDGGIAAGQAAIACSLDLERS